MRCKSVGGGDTICYDGYGRPLPKNHMCSQNLIEITPLTIPGGGGPPDTLPASRMIDFIIPDSSKIYGIDDGRSYYTYDPYNKEHRSHYLSVKEGGSISFQLYISPVLFRNFRPFIAKISDRSYLAFDSLHKDTLLITDTLSNINISGLDQRNSPVDITISGVNRRADTVQLVCDTCEDGLKAFCFEEMTFDSLRIYFVNSPSFNPDSVAIKNEINKILKQAVQKVSFVSKRTYNNTGWDDNGNGKMDFFPKEDSVPQERLERRNLLDSIESTFTDCYPCNDPQISRQTPKIIVTPSAINSNWLLMEDAQASSDTITVQYYDDFRDPLIRNVEFVISSWDGSNSETVKIHYDLGGSVTNEDRNRMGLKLFGSVLKYNHPRHSVLKRQNFPRGLTFKTTSCSWLMGSTNYHDVMHEFLHMRKAGPLSHDDNDSMNLMFRKSVNPAYNLLRYRQIITDDIMGNGFHERQWEIIRRNKS
ncbi:hypothetical protein JW979_04475 [bacterium]|nr:hypothetical protein [candidate division CSSED10-310 bacterium]RQV96607.1 MAG: hypothetical protein EH221_04700 [bacterium]